MAKTLFPGTVSLPNGDRFVANAVPDPFDERDLEYRPRLEPLAAALDQRDIHRYVMRQEGNSCTGHALATVINTVLGRRAPKHKQKALKSANNRKAQHVSAYMLYHLARRYDEFEGEEDDGSSLRGALKGWFNHGVALEDRWDRLRMENEPDLDDQAFIEGCRERPLGAYYRVNPYRLDDMQSAINELRAIAVSACIHEGWEKPIPMRRKSETMYLISRPVNAHARGGHAFALVGYNEIGFLVQNSWGADWGKKGFATLPYEDWLDSAYDAWVARSGVPNTPFATGRVLTTNSTGVGLATGRGPDRKRLEYHVINLGNQGRLSTTGSFVSTPAQIHRVFDRMGEWHAEWRRHKPGLKRHVMLYAHGGLISEKAGFEIAQKHINWWFNNRVYPIYFAWQSGPVESLVSQLVDTLKGKIPVGGIGFDLAEQFDRLVEKFARSSCRWMWEEMKENARAASDQLSADAEIQWPPKSSSALQSMSKQPGASLCVSRLKRYVEEHGADEVRVHLVGHSAGAIFLAPLLQRLADAGVKVDSLAFLAPALRIDTFRKSILPHLGDSKSVARFATFAMSDSRELNDSCGTDRIPIYQKSLLYLVSRALEKPGVGGGEVPLLGMKRFFDGPIDGRRGLTLQNAIEDVGGACIFSRSAAPADSRSDAETHGGFDDDPATMTSVIMRILDVENPADVDDYVTNAALKPIEAGKLSTRSPEQAGAEVADPKGKRTQKRRDTEPLLMVASTRPSGEQSVVVMEEAQEALPTAPPATAGLLPEVAVAPESGSPVLDVLVCRGWTIGGKTPKKRSANTKGGAKPKSRRRSPRRTAVNPTRKKGTVATER